MKDKLIKDFLNLIPCENSELKQIALEKKIKSSLRKKRLFDIIVILLSLPILVPLFLILSIIIKLDSVGSTFYSSRRVGRNGRVFDFYKFRTMRPGADLLKESLMQENESKEGVTFKIKNDPRITRVGKFLRKYSLDELPQLINVLVGDMSLVGPRPPISSEVALYSVSDFKRLHATPGLTCIWQISGRSEIPFHKQVEMDLEYIKNYKLSHDFIILFKTIPAVLKGSGAY